MVPPLLPFWLRCIWTSFTESNFNKSSSENAVLTTIYVDDLLIRSVSKWILSIVENLIMSTSPESAFIHEFPERGTLQNLDFKLMSMPGKCWSCGSNTNKLLPVTCLRVMAKMFFSNALRRLSEHEVVDEFFSNFMPTSWSGALFWFDILSQWVF